MIKNQKIPTKLNLITEKIHQFFAWKYHYWIRSSWSVSFWPQSNRTTDVMDLMKSKYRVFVENS